MVDHGSHNGVCKTEAVNYEKLLERAIRTTPVPKEIVSYGVLVFNIYFFIRVLKGSV